MANVIECGMVTILTLGCRTNQAESDKIGRELQARGVSVFFKLQENCLGGIYVINTCAVTGVAERKSRYEVSKIVKHDKDAKIIVAGCASANNEGQFGALNGFGKNVMRVFGTDKGGIVEYVMELITGGGKYGNYAISCMLYDIHNTSIQIGRGEEESDCDGVDGVKAGVMTDIGVKTRQVFMNVQNGCDNRCTFCIVSTLRGKSVSRPIEEVIEEIRELVYDSSSYQVNRNEKVDEEAIDNEQKWKNANAKLVVITGINLSMYDGGNGRGLVDLCLAVNELGVPFRLSSLYSNVITSAFINDLKKCENFVPMFHLSLQSGSDKVLKSMGRRYTTQEFEEVVELLRDAFVLPVDCTRDDNEKVGMKKFEVTADIIIGFPTEGDEEFRETLDFVKRVNFDNLHVFPYSPRKGTVAALWKQITQSVVKARVEELRQVQANNRIL
ncbi:MAG: radical SAM protein [Firmicutes bacterium]|nr:radical SAM protein [Bacillota bacterium]